MTLSVWEEVGEDDNTHFITILIGKVIRKVTREDEKTRPAKEDAKRTNKVEVMPTMLDASGEPHGDDRCEDEWHSIDDETDKRPHDCGDDDESARLRRRRFCFDERGRNIYEDEDEAARTANGEWGGEGMPELTPELATVLDLILQQSQPCVAAAADVVGPAHDPNVGDDAPDSGAARHRCTVRPQHELMTSCTSSEISLNEFEPSETVVENEAVDALPPPFPRGTLARAVQPPSAPARRVG